MPSTFIDLTNMLLRRLNEVEIAEADFGNTRGVQSLAKDAVRSSISKINQMEFEWPFNAVEVTKTLTAGVSEYSWPTDHKITDWESFQLQADASLNVGYKQLDYIDRDEWYRKHRAADKDAGASGRNAPMMVFPSHGSGFGVTPVPNAAYDITYRYYSNYTALSAASDQPLIPSSFDTTIVDGALYYMYMFRDNTEAAGATWQIFEAGIKALQSIYINNYSSITDRRVNFGGRY